MLGKDLIIISDVIIPKEKIEVTDLKYIFGFKVTNMTGHLIHWELIRSEDGKIKEVIIHE